MFEYHLKKVIDLELEDMKLNDYLKENIRNSFSKQNDRKCYLQKPWKIVCTVMVICILSGSTVFAGYYFMNPIRVNQQVLPELDSMEVVEVNKIEGTSKKGSPFVKKEFESYDFVAKKLGVDLLDSNLAENSEYTRIYVKTDNKDWSQIKVRNYIIGDTSDFEKVIVGDEEYYNCSSGEEYFSPISMEIDIIQSKNQLNMGLDRDFLGMYEYVESYTSLQGYKVNILQTTDDGEVSEKCGIFVADGIRYLLKGRVSVDELKRIIDSMK